MREDQRGGEQCVCRAVLHVHGEVGGSDAERIATVAGELVAQPVAERRCVAQVFQHHSLVGFQWCNRE